MRKLKLFFACLLMAFLSIGQVWAEDVADKLTASDFTATSTTYTDFSNVSKTSDAVYAGNSAKDASGNIQLRSKNSAGVVSTTSGGTVKSVKVTVASGTNTIDVYGSNTAYAGPSDLYGSTSKGTKVGSLSATGTVTFTDDYAYVGIRSNNGALYLSEIEITWTTGGSSDPTLSLAPSSLNLEAEGNSMQEITLSTTNFADAVNDVTCAFYNTAACDGDPISQPAWITNLSDNNTNLVSFDVVDNDGAARSVWMKVTASDGTGSASAILAISQKALVVDYATLPFAFTGGKSDIATTSGMTQSGIGTDYGDANAKLKFDTQGDWLIVKFNSAPGKVTYNIKNNSFSGGTFTVQESDDGEIYTDVVNHTEITGTQNEEHNLAQTSRYVKFIYTTKDGGNVGLGNIAISEYVAPAAVATPVISGNDPFVTSTTVSITCETAGATIYYTTDGTDPKDVGVEYTGSFVVSGATTTVRAIANLGTDWSDFAINTFDKVEALTTMDQIFAAATAAGSTATDVYITFDSWQISGVKNSNAFLTDGTEGAVIYGSGGSGFVENNVLSGTVACKVQLYKQFAEITSLTATSTGLTVTTGSALTPVVKTISELTAVNTGALVKVQNLDYDGTSLSDGTNTIITYNTFYTPTLVAGKKYTITGVFQYYDGTKQLLPRSVDDIQLVTEKTLSSISLSGTYPTTFEQDDAFSHAGMVVTANYTDLTTEDVTASATFTGYNMSTTGEQTVTVSYTENATTKTATYTINVSAPAPTGDWELFEGTLSELTVGNYLIYGAYQGQNSVMLGQIPPSSGRFGFEAATPDANGIISNPSGYAVWTLAKSGDYWTFYNAKAGKYAAGTGVNNKGQMIEDGTSDYALWSISDEFVITNKGNLAADKNATLRHNGTTTENYGFACYGATTGAQPVFYKPATPSYYITETLTGCTAADGNPTKVPQALTEDVVLKYNLSAGFAWPSAITVQVGSATLDPNNADYTWDTSVSPAELTIGQNVVNGDIAVTIVAQARELDNIAITQAPTKIAYFVGDFFNPAGLQIQLNYTSGDPETVVYNNDTKDDFSFSPDLETALAVTDETVEITYSTKSANQAISVTVPTPVAKTVVIIAEQGGNYYAMSNSVSSSSCAAIAVTKSGANLVVDTEEDKAAIQWLMTTTGNNATLQDAEGQYLSSAAGSGNLSKSADEVNWTKTEDGGGYLIAIGDSRALLFRTSGIFKHYAKSNLTSSPDEYFRISEFFEVAAGAANIIVNSTPTTYDYQRDGLAIGSVGTLCVDHNVASDGIYGATFYQLAGMEGNRVAFDDVTELDAGEPYLFIATASTVGVVYGIETAASPVEVNGMIGTYAGTTVEITEANKRNILYIANNSVYNCANLVAGSLTVPANRCYIDLGLNHTPVAQAPAAGHHRIVLGRDELTGIFDLNTSDAPRKQLINGTIYILRGDKVYDTTGRLVK